MELMFFIDWTFPSKPSHPWLRDLDRDAAFDEVGTDSAKWFKAWQKESLPRVQQTAVTAL